jgi:hypothetical protein
VVGCQRALNAWRCLLKWRAFTAFTIESESPISGHRIVGFGAGVFVSQAFLDEEIADPRPGLNARIIASLAEGQPVVLSPRELKRANTIAGVNIVFLSAAVRADVLDPDQVQQVQTQLSLACLLTYRGYRIHRVAREATDAADIAYMRSHGVYGTICGFEEFRRRNPTTAWSPDRALMVSTREDALARPGSVPAILYSYSEPILGLSDPLRELLEAAVHGLTDEQLAESLSLKLPTVKKRWAAAFEHVARVRPELLGTTDDPDRHTRGRQKRHLLLDYVREHPEELRPFLSSPARSGSAAERVSQLL